AAQSPARPAAQRPAPAPANASTAAAPAKTDEDCGCDAGPLPGVLAVVNGVRIASTDLSPDTVAQVGELEKRMAAARKQELERQINARLLDAEGKRRGVSADRVFEDEVVAKITQPTETEVQAFFDQHKAEIEAQLGHAAELKDVRADIVSSLLIERQQALEDSLSARLRASAQYQVLVTEVKPPANAADRARVLATVNGQPITAGSVEDAVLPLVGQVMERSYELRQQDLDMRINDLLLQQEAQKRQVTPKALLDAELATRSKPVTEAAAQTFYNENKERINGAFPQIKDQLIQYLKEQEQLRATGAYADELRRKATVQTFLQRPVVPALKIATED
ncbi:MAG TPA: hypothetical protein VE775_03905, partial [Pyrinomonadaceae bacterium]|nr:hypothetical protein [Pyrinomonadaceae bacterium]